jgi:hypothetical protein
MRCGFSQALDICRKASFLWAWKSAKKATKGKKAADTAPQARPLSRRRRPRRGNE